MKKYLALILFFVFILMLPAANASVGELHPINKKLVQMGFMPVPKYYPEIPRIPAEQAFLLYKQGKALFVLISYHDKDLIVGGIHLTEDKPPRINPNKLPAKKNQIIVVY